MKKLFSAMVALLITTTMMAQIPNLINYQAVARNGAGQALANQTITVRLSINKSAVNYYSETRQVTTNALGLFNVQIGSAGAGNVSGSINDINWLDNFDPGYVLKVELDINNSNLFTDMGSQKLVTVPYSFASRRADQAVNAVMAIYADTATIATEALKIMGKPVDRLDVPVTGDRLAFDGSKWVSVKKDTVYTIGGAVGNIPVVAGNPWDFAGPTTTITVTGNETIIAAFHASLGHTANNGVLVSMAVCYENVNGGAITSLNPTYIDYTIMAQPTKTLGAANASAKLPAGTYRIGLGIKNKSALTSLTANDNCVGVIEVKY